MEELSPTLCNQHRLFTAINKANGEPSIESWQALLAAANMINQLAIDELTKLNAELAELTVSAMNVTYPLDDEGEELATIEQCDLNHGIRLVSEQFIDINDIRIGAQEEVDRAQKALAIQHS
ncbi:MAG: hypothetical protein V7735_23455 [Photobacterium frigidiphilum]|uniref:hypothetical protein n=1 Tax=Photobacterium frigidiphilum TaxID=264736 RepID=UPI00300175F0